MLTLPNYSKATLLAAFFFLHTMYNNNAQADTETNLTTSTQSSQNSSHKVNSTYTIEKTTPNKDENTTTLIVKTLQNTVNLTLPLMVNGHTLPPKPDKSVNDSTLLGVDVNDNGVRDDVERWIYKTYKDKHPIHIDIAMQAARAWQKVLENPSKAKELYPIVDAPSYCESYYKIYAKYFNEKVLINEDITNEFFREKIIFNTLERKKAYLEYDKLLSGDSYTTPKIGDGKKLCDFNTSKYEE